MLKVLEARPPRDEQHWRLAIVGAASCAVGLSAVAPATAALAAIVAAPALPIAALATPPAAAVVTAGALLVYRAHGVGVHARARELERMCRLEHGHWRSHRTVEHLRDDGVERRAHRRVPTTAHHQAVAVLRDAHHVGEAELHDRPADEPWRRQRLHEDYGRVVGRGRAEQRGHRRPRDHVDVRVHAAVQEEHRVPPHVGALHACLERIVRAQEGTLARRAPEGDDVVAAARVIRKAHLHAEARPRALPLGLLRGQVERGHCLVQHHGPTQQLLRLAVAGVIGSQRGRELRGDAAHGREHRRAASHEQCQQCEAEQLGQLVPPLLSNQVARAQVLRRKLQLVYRRG